MGFWSRKRDAIDDLCESLVDRWWEWKPVEADYGDLLLESVCGLLVLLQGHKYSHDEVYFGANSSSLTPIKQYQATQVSEAVKKCLLNRQKAKKAKFSDTALALAKAVRDGDHTAAIGLADWVKENLGETQ